MKTLDQISLKENERQAIVELKNAILAQYPEAEIILFGSKARGDSSDESDMDLLILIDGDVDDFMRENIFDIAYIIELKYDVVFGIIVEAKVLWYSDKTKYIPLYNSIRKDGVITQ
ncbi:MAG TPA: nucleotidyltransferase domain-containing protein [Spirochaetota bacterium]|nr:nucleotidyltransferase domain-containing protein [Spirochaetota bacterium]HPP50353.1 nucleotidyltransferase domain-containing protein [Spirochaetota bacterium]